MFSAGEIISYYDIRAEEHTQIQRGMNYRLPSGRTVVLMSLQSNAPYVDLVEDEGRTIIYEGHDVPKSVELPDPKVVDQEATLPSGKLTQNGLFQLAVNETKAGSREAEIIRVYEKLRKGVWVFNGFFELTDVARQRQYVGTSTVKSREVFKFRLDLTTATDEEPARRSVGDDTLEHNRVIPSDVKLEVYKRDAGQCVRCGAKDNIHFDHVLPFSRGGTSLRSENIQLLCARHNLEKAAHIE